LVKKLSERRISVGFPEDIWQYLDKKSAYEVRSISSIVMGIVIEHVRCPSVEAKPVVFEKPVVPELKVEPKPAKPQKKQKPKDEPEEVAAPAPASFVESPRMRKPEYSEAVTKIVAEYKKTGNIEEVNMPIYNLANDHCYSVDAVLYDFYKLAGLEHLINELKPDIITYSNMEPLELPQGDEFDETKQKPGNFFKSKEKKRPSSVKALEATSTMTPEEQLAMMDAAAPVKYEK
jgi:hypothetical protein